MISGSGSPRIPYVKREVDVIAMQMTNGSAPALLSRRRRRIAAVTVVAHLAEVRRKPTDLAELRRLGSRRLLGANPDATAV